MLSKRCSFKECWSVQHLTERAKSNFLSQLWRGMTWNKAFYFNWIENNLTFFLLFCFLINFRLNNWAKECNGTTDPHGNVNDPNGKFDNRTSSSFHSNGEKKMPYSRWEVSEFEFGFSNKLCFESIQFYNFNPFFYN